MEMEKYKGRKKKIRVNEEYIGNKIIGDKKYLEEDKKWEFKGGIKKSIKINERRISIKKN